MTRFRLWLPLALTALALGALPALAQEAPTPAELAADESLPEFNRLVLEIASEYPTDGTHDYWWPRSGESQYDGCSRDMFLNGVQVMDGEEGQRTFCCGYTLEVFLEAYNRTLAETGGESAIDPADWGEFQRLWFVEEVNGPGPSAALTQWDLGEEIPGAEWESLLPGDFVQIWRGSGSGHSVIFLGWERDEAGEITGMHYFSTQGSTDGIAVNTESVGGEGIAQEHTWSGRVTL